MEEKMYKVINPGLCYPNYVDFFKNINAEEYLSYFEHSRYLSTYPTEARRFYLKAKGPHEINPNTIIAIIQEVNSKEVYLINVKALVEAD